ncbi:hypothetical protein Syun_012100 [Stephania yunnanensis]|uniref:Uncharacterized protein n=1 Tax=Stephania yunnanensis TaxID=152371 RepID=A0AAP0JZT8_9MAGN
MEQRFKNRQPNLRAKVVQKFREINLPASIIIEVPNEKAKTKGQPRKRKKIKLDTSKKSIIRTSCGYELAEEKIHHELEKMEKARNQTEAIEKTSQESVAKAKAIQDSTGNEIPTNEDSS